MLHPRPSAGADGRGAQTSLGGGAPLITPAAPAVQRLRQSPRLHIAFRRLHRCGPQPCAMFIAKMLGAIGADPASLDCVLTWCRHDLIAVLAGDFPAPSLRLVSGRAA